MWFGLESPGDGAANLVRSWSPSSAVEFFRKPGEIAGGFHRTVVQDQFARYAAGPGPPAMREWCRDLSQLEAP